MVKFAKVQSNNINKRPIQAHNQTLSEKCTNPCLMHFEVSETTRNHESSRAS